MIDLIAATLLTLLVWCVFVILSLSWLEVHPQEGRLTEVAAKTGEEKKSAQPEQGFAICSSCQRAYPPEPMVDGRCWLCRHGIPLQKPGKERA